MLLKGRDAYTKSMTQTSPLPINRPLKCVGNKT